MSQKKYATPAPAPPQPAPPQIPDSSREQDEPPRVLVAGDVCRDVYTRGGRPVDTCVGGSGANTAWWLARHGCQVTLVCQGHDSDRLAISETLRRAGVSVWFRPVEATSEVTIDVDTGVMDRAAGPGEVPRFVVGHIPGSGFDLLHMTGCLVEAAGSGPAARLARRFDGPVSMAVGPLAHDPGTGADIAQVLPACRMVTANTDEARALTGQEDPAAAAEALSSRWRTAAVTTGPGPVHVAGRHRRGDATIELARVIDGPAAGAGDCFTATWLARLLAGHTPAHAARHAADQAAAVVGASPTGDTPLYWWPGPETDTPASTDPTVRIY